MKVNDAKKNSVQFVSWNCKGLNGAIKRGNVLFHLDRLGADIVFLQETHIRNQDHGRLRGKWVGQIFHSNFSFKSRGTAILIKKNVQFTATKVISDSNGRYVIVAGKLYNTLILLVNVYAPNIDDEQFISSILNILPNLDTHQLIMGGDFNFVLDPFLDRSSSRTVPLAKSAKLLQTFMKNFKIVDPWRFTFPNQRKYSFFSPVHHSYSRIDFFLIDYKLLSAVLHADYEAMVLSDHSPLGLQILFETKYDAIKWRFDNSLQNLTNQSPNWIVFRDKLYD